MLLALEVMTRSRVGTALPPWARWPNAPATTQGHVLRHVGYSYNACAAEQALHPEIALEWISLSWRNGNQHGPWGSRFAWPGCSTWAEEESDENQLADTPHALFPWRVPGGTFFPLFQLCATEEQMDKTLRPALHKMPE